MATTRAEPIHDPRLDPVSWRPGSPFNWRRPWGRALLVLNVVLAARYIWWLLQPGRAANVGLYALLVGAEAFNLLQGAGFWWTLSRLGRPRPVARGPVDVPVDVLIPTYDEPVEIVEPTVAAARRIRGADVRIHLLDDGGRPEMEAMARRHGAGYLARAGSEGAKAGNVNEALGHTDAPFVAVLDCDHVPAPDFLEVCLAQFDAPDVAFVQTPQYYANGRDGGVAGASWSQQALFFGIIAPGRDELGAMFCCGTNVVFRRAALEDVGGFPQESVTEDFELSIRLHERGWRSRYVPEVLAHGLGPEDMASYVSQQQRWSRGCLSALPAVMRSALPARQKVQYALSASFFLTGWTVLVYMTFPVVRLLTGAQPLASTSADQFLAHFAPYFGLSLLTVTVLGGGAYTFKAFALQAASFWIHVQSTVLTLIGRRSGFVVTPKEGAVERQPRAVAPALAAIAVLCAVAAYGLLRDRDPATLNNVAFAALHICVLAAGVAPALRREPVPALVPAPA
jgi:cellulose synthase (UDP-forming)